MGVRQSVTELLIGNPPRRRSQYIGVAVSLAVLVAVLLPSEWIGTHIWWFAGVGVLIPLIGGVGSYGLVSALCGTGPYVAVIGEAAFLASSSATYPLSVIVPRLVLVLAMATAIITLSGYLLGVGVRTSTNNWTA